MNTKKNQQQEITCTSFAEFSEIEEKNIKAKKYVFEKDLQPILSRISSIVSFTEKEKAILKHFFQSDSIPDETRGEIWFILSGAKREMKNNPDYYKNILNDYPKMIPRPALKLSNKKLKEILDVKELIFFSPEEGELLKDTKTLQKVKNIFEAYIRRNDKIGYWTGILLIIAKLLSKFNDEEKVFWLFVQIVEVFMPTDYFFTGIDLKIDEIWLAKILEVPFQPVSFEISHLIRGTIKKFLSGLMSFSVSNTYYDSIYDAFFFYGETVIYNSIRFLFSNFLKNSGDLSKFTLNIKETYRDFTEKNEHFKAFICPEKEKEQELNTDLRNILFDENSKNVLNNEEIIKIRENTFNYFLDKVSKEKLDQEVSSILSHKASENCYVDWPFCIQEKDFKYERKEFDVLQVLNFKKIESYFYCLNEFEIVETESEKKKVPTKNEKEYQIYADLLIRRRDHICLKNGNKKTMKELYLKNQEIKVENLDEKNIVDHKCLVDEFSIIEGNYYQKFDLASVLSEDFLKRLFPDFKVTESIMINS